METNYGDALLDLQALRSMGTLAMEEDAEGLSLRLDRAEGVLRECAESVQDLPGAVRRLLEQCQRTAFESALGVRVEIECEAEIVEVAADAVVEAPDAAEGEGVEFVTSDEDPSFGGEDVADDGEPEAEA